MSETAWMAGSADPDPIISLVWSGSTYAQVPCPNIWISKVHYSDT